jgi:hypothetical protein
VTNLGAIPLLLGKGKLPRPQLFRQLSNDTNEPMSSKQAHPSRQLQSYGYCRLKIVNLLATNKFSLHSVPD